MLTFSNQHEFYTGTTHMQSQFQPGSPFFSHTIFHGILMCSPAGPVEKSLSIVVPDIWITVSFSHQISHHIQMTITAVFEKANTCSTPHSVHQHRHACQHPGFSGGKTFFLLCIIILNYSALHNYALAYAPDKRLEVKLGIESQAVL